jgi:hypothetical protein
LIPDAVIISKLRRLTSLVAAATVEARLNMLANAFKYDPGQPRVPAGSPEGGQWTSDGESTIGGQFPRFAARISPAREAQCEQQRLHDEIQCRFVGLRACWTQAYLRYGNCLAGLPIPPLNY